MSELVGHNEKIKTEVLRTVDVDSKNRLTIEKILAGQYAKCYIIRSEKKGLFGYKLNSLAAWEVESDESHSYISSYKFKVFRMLEQAVKYAKHVKKNKYPNWIKYQ